MNYEGHKALLSLPRLIDQSEIINLSCLFVLKADHAFKGYQLH